MHNTYLWNGYGNPVVEVTDGRLVRAGVSGT